MDKGRTNLREIAALATVVRSIVDGIKAKGHPPVAAQYAALDAVDAFVRGGKLTKKDAERLSKAAYAEGKRFGVESPPPEKALSWVSGPVMRLVQMVVRGDEDRTETLTQASYALGSLYGLEWADYDRRTKDLFAKALETHAGLPDAPLGEKRKRVNKEKAATEEALLARSRAALPPYGHVLLDRIGAERDAKQVGTRDELLATLKKHGYPAWDAVVRFDEDFGGLLIPYDAGKRWREDNVCSVCGPYAGLKAGGDRMRREGLVPVYFAANDMIGFLDEKGEAWLGGVLDGQLTALHCSGAELVATTIAYDLLQVFGATLSGIVWKPGLVGERVAKELGLAKVADYGPAKLWVSGEALVSELQGTQLGALTERAWKRIEHALAEGGQSPADLFQEAGKTQSPADIDRAYAALLGAIPGCDSFAAVQQLFAPSVMRWVTHVDAHTRWRAIASALVTRALSMGPEEGSKTLGWTATSAGAEWSRLEGWSDWSKRRVEWCEGINAHIDELRAWLKDASPERRTSAAWALALCPSATNDDAKLLLDALEKEEDGDARATELMVLGWLPTSAGADRAKALEVLRAPAKPAALVAVCAVAGLVWMNEPLSHAEAMVLVHHLRRTTKLPAVWAWSNEEGTLPGSGRLAEAAAKAMKLVEGNQTVTVLLALVSETKPGTLYYALKQMLARAAFGRWSVPPREGLALEDLGEHDRKVLTALVVNGRFTGSIFGLNEVPLREMLEQKLPEWRPVDVTVDGKLHRWDYTRILAAVAFGELDPRAGRDAVVRAFTPAEAAELASSWSKARVPLDRNVTRDDERARMLDLCLGILDDARARGADVDALCAGYAKSRSADHGILTLWSIRAHEGRPPEDHYALYGAAMAMAYWHEALLGAIKGLPSDVRTRVFHQADPWVLDFWVDALDEVTVPKLVYKAAGSPQLHAELIAMLKAAGPGFVAMAEAVTSDKPLFEERIAVFREALRKAVAT